MNFVILKSLNIFGILCLSDFFQWEILHQINVLIYQSTTVYKTNLNNIY